MPDSQWYELMYGGRDGKLLALEPGHRYFLRDHQAPRHGTLLDIGCGTGSFLAAARERGYEVTGTELDGNAAAFATEKLGLPRVIGLTVAEFAKKYPDQKFDVVTFFEVLEHQAEPVKFLSNVKACLRSQGYVALSVPNRERWLTGPDVLDYPPNHFLRWSSAALKNFLQAQGFEIVSMQEEPVRLAYTAQMINMKLRTGLARRVSDGALESFRDVMQMDTQEARQALEAKPTAAQRMMRMLGRAKAAACLPIAAAAHPYVRIRGHKGAYLYCLARIADSE